MTIRNLISLLLQSNDDEYKSMMVSSEIDLVTDFSLDVWNVLSHHYLTFPLLDEICLALYGRPVDLFFVLCVVKLHEVLVLLHEAVVHLGGVPFVEAVVEFGCCAFGVLACHVLTHDYTVNVLLYGSLLFSFGFFLVVLLIIHHSLEQRFIEDKRLVYLPAYISIELIHFTIGYLFGFRLAFDTILPRLLLLRYLGHEELFKVDIMVIGYSVLFEIAEMTLILAFLSLSLVVIPRQHFAHVQSLALPPEVRQELPFNGVVCFCLIFLIMEEALLMFVELGLKPHVDFGLSADKGFFELVVQRLSIALEIWLPSGLFLDGLNVVQFVDVEVLLAAFVHGGGDESFFELGSVQC